MGTDTSLDALSGMLFELSQAGVDVRFAARVSDEFSAGHRGRGRQRGRRLDGACRYTHGSARGRRFPPADCKM